MYIPEWLFWAAYLVVLTCIAVFAGRQKSDYDGLSGVVGVAIFLIGFVLMMGYIIGGLLAEPK